MEGQVKNIHFVNSGSYDWSGKISIEEKVALREEMVADLKSRIPAEMHEDIVVIKIGGGITLGAISKALTGSEDINWSQSVSVISGEELETKSLSQCNDIQEGDYAFLNTDRNLVLLKNAQEIEKTVSKYF